jgi:hypothetical protein
MKFTLDGGQSHIDHRVVDDHHHLADTQDDQDNLFPSQVLRGSGLRQ